VSPSQSEEKTDSIKSTTKDKGYDSDGVLGSAKARAKQKRASKRATISESPMQNRRRHSEKIKEGLLASLSQSEEKTEEKSSQFEEKSEKKPSQSEEEEKAGESKKKDQRIGRFSTVWDGRGFKNPLWDMEDMELEPSTSILSGGGEKLENECAGVLDGLENEHEVKENTGRTIGVEEYEALQKEVEILSFHNESLELQLQDETRKTDELSEQVNSGVFNVALKFQFEQERKDWAHQMDEKELIIKRLQSTIDSMDILQPTTGSIDEDQEDERNLAARGEGMKKISILQRRLLREEELATEESTKILKKKQKQEIDELNFEEDFRQINGEKQILQMELDKLKKDTEETMKRKDETVRFFQNELSKIKPEQATRKRGSSTGFLGLPTFKFYDDGTSADVPDP
jgi:hypothetical protein